MKFNLSKACLLALMVFSSRLYAEPPTLESVEKELVAKWDAHKSLSADITVVHELDSPEASGKSTLTGKYLYMRKDGKSLVRQEGTSTGSYKEPDKEPVEREGKVLLVADGEFVHNHLQGGDEPTIIKTRQGTSQDNLGGPGLFENLHKNFTLKLLPEEKINGEEVYVIEATAGEKPSTMGLERMVYYLSKKTGIALKAVMTSSMGGGSTTMTTANIKLNPEIDPEKFVFHAPEGVKIEDYSDHK